jgi:ribosome biogenesis GTPase
MKIEELGYSKAIREYRTKEGWGSFDVGRISSEHKERYHVLAEDGEFEAEVIGNLRFAAKSRADFPAVGDWVAISKYDEDKVLIHAILPRSTIIERQAVGAYGEKQIIATNVDYAFIVQAVDRDFNINRLERYLSICHTSGISPIILLSKIDLQSPEKIQEFQIKIKGRIKQVSILSISNISKKGYDDLFGLVQKGKTYCLLGSSGVGKSTLLNNLIGKSFMETAAISSSSHKGKHVTTHRQMVLLEKGGVIIDNPGMREVGMTENASGIDLTFSDIVALAKECKYSNCTHTSEDGCAVLLGVEKQEISQAAYHNFLKMHREKAHFESSLVEKRKKDKAFGKMIKNYKKHKNKKENGQ